MFIHNFKYTLTTLFRSKMLIFWTFAFPIILGTFFNMAFSNIENSEKLDIINIAIIENETLNNNEILKSTFNELGKKGSDNQVFSISYTTEDEAKSMLDNDEITGYLLLNENSEKVIVKQSGINETIFKYIVEEIIQTKEILTNITEEKVKEEYINGNTNVNISEIYQNILEKINKEEQNIEDISSSNLSYTMIEFYTLIAMTCLYGGILGMVTINNALPNMSNNGKRVAVSPISKGKLVISGALASYITQIVGLALLFAYTIFVLKVDYGSKLLPIILLALCGSFAGLTFGIAVGSIFKTNDNVKIGIMISITMLGCFLSGMMGITMKYIVDKNIPIVNKLNPASIITDGFYALYYYDTMNRYWFNIGSLLVFSFIMLVLSFTVLRRQKYDSI